METVIGVDFDNTIVSYDQLMHHLGVEWNLISPDTPRIKQVVRDRIRELPDGEAMWQNVQAAAYGTQMSQAKLIDGVTEFFQMCKGFEIKAYIVSHKTQFGRTGVDLRQAALNWMESNNFFDVNHLGIDRENVFFEATRAKKSERIALLGCTHFIDDLEEMFCDPSFPANVQKILYDPHAKGSKIPEVKVAPSWQKIYDYFFDGR